MDRVSFIFQYNVVWENHIFVIQILTSIKTNERLLWSTDTRIRHVPVSDTCQSPTPTLKHWIMSISQIIIGVSVVVDVSVSYSVSVTDILSWIGSCYITCLVVILILRSSFFFPITGADSPPSKTSNCNGTLFNSLYLYS
jgi:hypothetical protein